LEDITLNKHADFKVYGSLYEPVCTIFVFRFPSVDSSNSGSAKCREISFLGKGNVSDSFLGLKMMFIVNDWKIINTICFGKFRCSRNKMVGQHYLIDPNIVKKSTNLLEIGKDVSILEFGSDL
jgi:hypothetical protein